MKHTLEIDLPEAVTFYGDPICPWTLKTYNLISKACNSLDINLRYRPLSLKIINENNQISDEIRKKLDENFFLLETEQLLVDQGLEKEAIKLYEISADFIMRQEEMPSKSQLIEFLDKVGFRNSSEILNNNSESQKLQNSLRTTYENLKTIVGDDCGSPVVILEPDGVGFFGPIVTDPDQIDAKDFFINYILLSRTPTFSEIKRKR